MCKKNQEKTLSNTVHRLPPYLVLHLKRFDGYEKDCSSIDLNLQLKVNGHIFTLKEVMTHIGRNIDDGHYVTYVSQTHGIKKNWLCFDDSVVSVFILSSAFSF